MIKEFLGKTPDVEDASFIADNSLIIGVPARAVRMIDEKTAEAIAENAREYFENAKLYNS